MRTRNRWFDTRAARRALLVALTAAPALAAQNISNDQGDEVQPRGFAIPDGRQARAQCDRAAEQIAAKRWPEAIAALQDLLVAHRGEVLRLDATSPAGAGAPASSANQLHRGVGDWARAQLVALPPEARAAYRDRYSGEAAAALERGRLARDRRELVEVTRRYPLCDAARDAWWTLGDIEFEAGNSEAALSAWNRAAELTRALGQELSPAARARLESNGGDDAPGIASGTERTAFSAPGADCASWRRRIENNTHAMPIDSRQGDPVAILPSLAGDTLLVSDSMRLYAFDAWTGATRWTSDEAPGWDAVDRGEVRPRKDKPALRRQDFFDGVQRASVIIQPAASAGIALAGLQIPVTNVVNVDFNNQFTITKIIPDRRLFAFDLASGRELWNHLPPRDWDGETGTFAERMRLAAPPVIAGSRVIVPAYRMQGRVDLHVACFDLYTGRTLWSTALVSGQIELNMFGRPEHEFCAAPVCVAGDRAIVLTQLGAVAALDLYTGDILWETLYEPIPIPMAQRWAHSETREQLWSNTPAVVVGKVVVATPLDSAQMLGLDLENGALLWSPTYGRVTRSKIPDTNSNDGLTTLLGADETTIWLANNRVISVRSPRGLGDRAWSPELSSESDDLSGGKYLPRPALTSRSVIVASPSRRVVIDRLSLKREDRLATADWGTEQSAGNVLVGDGALFFATPRFVTACVDWPIVEKRYRERCENNPHDLTAALEYAGILTRRGETLLDEPRLRPAIELLERARSTLESYSNVADSGTRGALDAQLHAILYLEARAALASADAPKALEHLRHALELAPSERSACRTLVSIAELQAAQGARDDWFATLAQLDARCHTLPMPDEWWSAGGAERFGVSAGETSRGRPIPVGLWVEIVLSQEYAKRNDTPREFEQLHRILAEWNDAMLPAPEGSNDLPQHASAVIQARLDAGAAEAYAPFERRAREMFDKARAEHDTGALERLAKWYPHSDAAREAIDARIAAALEAGDARTVAALALTRVPDDWAPARARPSEIQSLLSLGAALDDLGNHEFARDLLRALAADHGELISPLARDHGATLETLARALPNPPAADKSETPATWDHLSNSTTYPGSFVDAGSARYAGADGAQHELVFLVRREARQDTLLAFDGTSIEPIWAFRLERGAVDEARDVVCTADTVVVSGRAQMPDRAQISAIDVKSGEPRWNWPVQGERLERIQGASGIVLLTLRAPDGRARMLALDAFGGLELWTRPIGREYWPWPVHGSARVALLPMDYAQSPARVFDLFTGAREVEIALPEHVGELDVQGAWISGKLLILPSFPKTSASAEAHDVVTAWDMNTGKRAWHVLGDEQRSFDSIARRGDDSYLLFLGGTPQARTGFVLELDTKLGATRRVQNAALAADDVLVGLPRHGVVDIDGPFLMVRSSAPGGEETLLRAIHLPYGERWAYRLPIAAAQFYNRGPMPLPELSASTLVMAYSAGMRGRQGGSSETKLLYFDRDNGLLRGSQALAPNFGQAENIQLVSLGSVLWVVGQQGMFVMQKKP